MAITVRTAEDLEALGDLLGLGDKLAEGEFASLVATTQALLGVDVGAVEEESVTHEGLVAMAKLFRVKKLGIDTKEGRRVSVIAGILARAGKKLLDEYREEIEDIRRLDRGP